MVNSYLPNRRTVLYVALMHVSMHSKAVCAGADLADSGLQEVVVTATKRSTTTLNTPASVSSIAAELLGVGSIESVADLSESVPGISVGNQFGINRTFIRGIGLTSIDLGGDGAVAYLSDGAQIARPSEQLSKFFDLDRVEVLRGPQGTLYGRGATAGVINLVTHKPNERTEGYVDLSYGNYSSRTVEAATGGAIAEGFFARIAAKIERHDGYGTNLFTGAAVDDRDAQALRASFRVLAKERLTIDLSVDYTHENDNNYAFHYFGPTTTTNAQLPAELYFGGKTLFDCCGTAQPNLRNVWSSVNPLNKRHGAGVTATVEWSHDDFNWKSLTAYRRFARFNEEDLADSNARLYGRDDYDEKSGSYSQDFTLQSRAFNIDWLSGIGFFHERLFGSVRIPTVGLAVTLTGGNCFPRVALAPTACDSQDAGHYWQRGTVSTSALGAFIEGKKQLTRGLSMTVGARISREQRTGVGSFIFDAFAVDIPTDRSASWNAITPKLLIEYQGYQQLVLYGSINRGFKSGVINVGSTNPVVAPEYVYAYEIGVKAGAWDNHLNWTVATFFYDYKNLQIGFVNAQNAVETVNAAAAHNYGVEAEMFAKLNANWEIQTGVTYLSAKYTSFVNGYYRSHFTPVDIAGNYLDNAPPFTSRLGIEYVLPLSVLRGRLRFRAEGEYQARVYFTEFNNADATQGGTGLLNGRAAWESVGGRWRVSAWVRNATDKFAIANTIIAAPAYDNVRIGSVNSPRTFGITVGYAH